MAKKRTPYDKPKPTRVKKIKMPPCPDPDLFIAVKRKDGTFFWRRKRGSVTEAVLNPVLAAVAKNKKSTMAAAARVVQALEPFICNRYEDTKYAAYKRNDQRFSGLFTRSILTNGKMDWSFFNGFDINPNCPFEKIMPGNRHQLTMNKNTATVMIPMSDNMVEKLRNRATTHFYFELILISGNPAKENSLRSENDKSDYYAFTPYVRFNVKPQQYCELSIVMPEKKPYILILKVATTEQHYYLGPNHEGLKVIAFG